jgi:hypothetical protein
LSRSPQGSLCLDRKLGELNHVRHCNASHPHILAYNCRCDFVGGVGTRPACDRRVLIAIEPSAGGSCSEGGSRGKEVFQPLLKPSTSTLRSRWSSTLHRIGTRTARDLVFSGTAHFTGTCRKRFVIHTPISHTHIRVDRWTLQNQSYKQTPAAIMASDRTAAITY